MKKKWIFCICTCLLLFVLGGCGAKIPDMTEEERKAISEYAANLLLKYDELLNSLGNLYRTDIPREVITAYVKARYIAPVSI